MEAGEEQEVDPKREERIRKIQALLSKTVENGCTEEEAASAQSAVQNLMEKWAIEDGDLGLGEKFRLYEQVVNVSHPDSSWRGSLLNAVALNTGVYCVRFNANFRHASNKGSLGTGYGHVTFAGQEHAVKGAALVAEYLVKTVESLSSQYARVSGSGQTGRRQFAKACAFRVCRRVRESFNLSGDPKLPLIISNNLDLAKTAMAEKHGGITTRKSSNKMSGTIHELRGMMAGDGVDLRGHARMKRIG